MRGYSFKIHDSNFAEFLFSLLLLPATFLIRSVSKLMCLHIASVDLKGRLEFFMKLTIFLSSILNEILVISLTITKKTTLLTMAINKP
ncbi:MAG: hypothetical protein ACI8PB_005323 [Desulforhopalus sp.]|jgi:hypothetical protein